MTRGNPRPGFPRTPSTLEGMSTDRLLPHGSEYSRPRRPQR